MGQISFEGPPHQEKYTKEGNREMSETTAKSTKAGLLTLTAAVGALLVILVAEMVSAKPASAEIISSPPPVTVPESGFLTPSGYRDP